jgi:tetratricopeptide (TPR) repeat protein
MTPKNPVRQVVTVAALAVFFTLSTLSCAAWGQGVHVEETGQAVDCGASKESACARLEQGAALMAQGEYTAAIAVLDGIVRRFGADASPAMREVVAGALLDKGVALARQGEFAAAIAVFDAIVPRYGKDAAPGVRRQVARAIFNKCAILKAQGAKSEDVRRVFHEIDRRTDNQVDADFLFVAVLRDRLIFQKPKYMTLEEQGRNGKAIAIQEEVRRRRFGKYESPGTRPGARAAAAALFHKGEKLRKQGKADAAIHVFDEIDRRYGEALPDGVREIVARALVSKGQTLRKQADEMEERAAQRRKGRALAHDEPFWPGHEKRVTAIRTFDEINRRYGGQEESSATRKWVAEAIRAKEELEPRACCSGK